MKAARSSKEEKKSANEAEDDAKRSAFWTQSKHTVRDDGVRPADPLAIEGQDNAAVLVLVFRSHCGATRRNKRMKSAGYCAVRDIR